MKTDFPLVETKDGWRLEGFGEYFQAKCRTPEWRAALIVYEKYKRKLNLDHAHLIELSGYADIFSVQRRAAGKPASAEHLIQAVSAYCKRTFKAS